VVRDGGGGAAIVGVDAVLADGLVQELGCADDHGELGTGLVVQLEESPERRVTLRAGPGTRC
jgi:hypothetical protein